jgi:hypothetical protein
MREPRGHTQEQKQGYAEGDIDGFARQAMRSRTE